MKKIYLFALSLLVFSSYFIPTSVFASCAGPFTTKDHLDMADIVATGTVKGDFFGSYMKFQVDRYYKGTGPATIAVRGSESNMGITSVDYELKSGQSYLLFLKKVDDISYKTNSCAGNKALGQGSTTFTAEEAAILGSGSAPDISDDHPLISKDYLGWLMAIVGYGYVLPILLALSIAYLAFILLYKFTKRIRIRNYQFALIMISGAYIILYFYIQRVI